MVEDLVQKGRITPEEARLHPRKNLITRALGAEAHVRADLYHLNLNAGDCLLLCSDGLSNIVTDQEILYEIIHGGEKESCCRRLLDIAHVPGGTGQCDGSPAPGVTHPVPYQYGVCRLSGRTDSTAASFLPAGRIKNPANLT